MNCKYSEMLAEYLEEKLSVDEERRLERHLDACRECQSKLDQILSSSVKIEAKLLDIEDEILVSKIKARIKGIRRISLYGILGFLIGLFARFYTLDRFLLTKAILALPYKLAEFALGIFFSGNVLPFADRILYYYQGKMGFFPFHPILDLLATSITPAIILSFIAIIIGYLVSDKKVFQRKKIIRFLGAWLIIFLLWTAGLYSTYALTLNRINNLEGMKSMTVYKADKNGTSWLIKLDQEALNSEKYRKLIEIITQTNSLGITSYPWEKDGFEIAVDFFGGGTIPMYIDTNADRIHLLNGQTYQLSSEDKLKIIKILGGINND